MAELSILTLPVLPLRTGVVLPVMVVTIALEDRRIVGAVELIRSVQERGAVADLAGYSPDLSVEQKLEILETLDVERRLEVVIAWARDVLAAQTLKDRIRKDVAEGMEKSQ